MKTEHAKLEKTFAELPVIAILRGVTPDDAVEIGSAIAEAGIKLIEVPLNSPKPFNSIEKLASALGSECVVGCGTLIRTKDVRRVADAGGEIAVTPNTNPDLIEQCLRLGMVPIPGWATPTDAFAAYRAGARYLKLFPASTYGLGHVKATRAVLPDDVRILAVGGVGPDQAAEWLAGGVDGFGIGSDLYTAGRPTEEVAIRAKKIVDAVRAARQA